MMKNHIYNPDANRRKFGKEKGKCVVCGLDTTLNIHSHCGEKLHPKHKVRVFKEKECKNVDCGKVYKPTSSRQKLCPECSEISIRLASIRLGYRS